MPSVVHDDDDNDDGFTIVIKGNMLYSTLKYLPFVKMFVGKHLDLKWVEVYIGLFPENIFVSMQWRDFLFFLWSGRKNVTQRSFRALLHL